MSELIIKDLHVSVGEEEILKGVNLKVNSNEVHALMGPNGAGKSTLGYAIMGHPKYRITKGEIIFDGIDVTKLSTDKRAKLGLFLGFQYPAEISGVTLSSFLRESYAASHPNGHVKDRKAELASASKFVELLKEKMKLLHIEESFASRYLNEGFSGGEKKRCEILQLAILQPHLAILDETDSGLDIDSLKIVSDGINELSSQNIGILLITHYQRILNYIKPSFVHVLYEGRIIKEGGKELAQQIESEGYDKIIKGAS